MKSRLFIIYFLIQSALWATGASGQVVEIPEIISISLLNNTQTPIISWKLNYPELVDGFIVKRFIRRFPGVVDNSYQNICTIENRNILSFRDTSSVFGAAHPEIQSEYYRITAYKINSGDTLFSPMSAPIGTIFLKTAHEFCEKNVLLTWRRSGLSENRFKILKAGSDTIFSELTQISDTFYHDYDITINQRLFYKIIQISSNSFSESPVVEQKIRHSDKPDKLQIECITVDTAAIKIHISIDSLSDTEKLVLLRNFAPNMNFDTINTFTFQNGSFQILSDSISNKFEQNHYFIIATDTCRSELNRSDTLTNLVLKLHTEAPKIQINIPQDKQYTQHIIFRIADNETNSIIQLENEYSYTDNLSDYYKTHIFDENFGLVCYFNLSIPEGKNCTSQSAFTCIIPEEIISIPNAFNTDDVYEENRTFRPKAAFLDNYKMWIYGRNGNLLFETRNLSEGWDGTDQTGRLQPVGTYMYMISYTNSAGQEILKKGHVTLIFN